MSEHLFELTPEKIEIRLISVRRGIRSEFVHNLRTPAASEWIEYDRSLHVAIEDVEENGEMGIRIRDNQAKAKCDLWDKIAVGIEGYTSAALSDFCLIPPFHKQTSIDHLLAVRSGELQTESDIEHYFDSGSETVCLEGFREHHFPCLIHHFQIPAAKDRIEYQRIHSDSIVVRGMKSGRDKVLLPSRMQSLIALYDRLILSVSGYCIEGQPLTEDKQQIIRHMDAQHKSAAMRDLFGSEILMIKEDESCNVESARITRA